MALRFLIQNYHKHLVIALFFWKVVFFSDSWFRLVMFYYGYDYIKIKELLERVSQSDVKIYWISIHFSTLTACISSSPGVKNLTRNFFPQWKNRQESPNWLQLQLKSWFGFNFTLKGSFSVSHVCNKGTIFSANSISFHRHLFPKSYF